MAIVSYDFYRDTFLGEPIASDDFPRAEIRAERIIAQITHGRATEATFPALPAFQQNAVKEAICTQIEYYAMNGTDISINGETSSGWTTGKVTVHASSKASAKPGVSMLCAAAMAALEQTGLLDPAVPVMGMPPAAPVWPFWEV